MSGSLFFGVVRLAAIGASVWGVVMALWALLIVWIYPSIASTFPYQEFLQSVPEEFLAAMGIKGEEGLAMLVSESGFTLVGYVNTEYISWLPVMLGIYAVVYCGGLVAQEVERGTLDLLLSQPLSRTSFLLSKYVGFITLLLGISALSFAVLAIGSVFLEDEMNPWYLAEVHAVALLLVVAIAGYSTLASCLFLDPRRALAVAGLVTALTYFVNIIGLAVDPLSWLKYLSLFHYFDSLQVLAQGEVNWAGMAVYAGVAAASMVAAALVFRRKDLVR